MIRAINDSSKEVQQAAYQLLRSRPEPRIKQALALFSSTGIDYRPFKDLLEQSQWRAADQQTKILMGEACGLTQGDQFKPKQIQDVPCDDLRIIDHLWVKYSDGRFGFTVQQAIWLKYDRRYWDKAEAWSSFADQVGWRVGPFLVGVHWKRYEAIQFSANAPVGHLPFLGDLFGIFTIEAFSDRFKDCRIS